MPRALHLRIVVATALAMVLPASAVLAGGGLLDLAGHVQAALHRAQALRGIGWVAFAAVQMIIVASGALPASLAGIAAGAIYGVPLGFGLNAASIMAGALLTFAVSRSLARGLVERFVARHTRLENLDRLLAQDGVRLVCLLRLSPVMPFAATSYALGLSSVSLRDYLLGTLASLPALLGYVVLGRIGAAALSADTAGAAPLRWAMLGFGAVATVALVLHLGRLLARAGIVPRSVREGLDRGAHPVAAEPGAGRDRGASRRSVSGLVSWVRGTAPPWGRAAQEPDQPPAG